MKNLSVANGTYEKDGQTKTRWVNIGKIMSKDGKEFMLLDPTINLAGFPRDQGRDMVMVGIFEENNQQQQNQNQQQNQYQKYNQQNQNQQQGGYNPNQQYQQN